MRAIDSMFRHTVSRRLDRSHKLDRQRSCPPRQGSGECRIRLGPQPGTRRKTMFEQTLEGEDVAGEVRRLFRELARAGGGCREVAAECAPVLDVFETPTTFEVRVDVPGIARE